MRWALVMVLALSTGQGGHDPASPAQNRPVVAMPITPFHNRLRLFHNSVRFLSFHHRGCCGMKGVGQRRTTALTRDQLTVNELMTKILKGATVAQPIAVPAGRRWGYGRVSTEQQT